MNPISIVIPTYNRAHVLTRTFPSYARQEPSVQEIIYVDDASTDNTADLIRSFQERYPFVKYVKHEVRKGLPAARNTGVRYAAGQYIAFGEDDVEFSPSYCSTLMEHMQRTRADIMAGRLIYLLPGQTYERAIMDCPPLSQPVDVGTFTGNFYASPSDDVEVPFVHACALVHKSVFEYCSYAEKAFPVNYFREETDFYLRAVGLGFKIGFCPHTVAFHLPRAARLEDRGGIWPQSAWEYKFWRQVNNITFLLRNRRVIRDVYGLNIVSMAVRFWASALRRLVA